ncbi:hypothetical protein [Acinetobacter johnsonii]|uniref:hypothetical protein n=1 Tax=Acinetobacter johnsonii TaxID=40214 RepID=UPI00244C8C18|nr:hypothetical protein [Acinetobacter johnsonii]MDH1800472.1 hypothetical protein [Acinetobacter johnsonii]
MSEFEEYIKVNYPRDYERQKRIYPDQRVEELYSEDYKMWQHQQAIIENLKAQLNNMEACYIEKKKECEELQGRIDAALEIVNKFCEKRYPFNVFCGEMLDALRGAND